MCRLWCAAAAFCVLTTAGRLAARLPVLSVNLGLHIHNHTHSNGCMSKKLKVEE